MIVGKILESSDYAHGWNAQPGEWGDMFANGVIDPDAAWVAAHVDEDWNMELWGRDELALERRARRRAEFDAAVAVLASTTTS